MEFILSAMAGQMYNTDASSYWKHALVEQKLHPCKDQFQESIKNMSSGLVSLTGWLIDWKTFNIINSQTDVVTAY